MKRPIRRCGVALALGICLAQGALGAVSFTGSYSETFDSLPNSGAATGWTNDSTLSGWSAFKRPAPGTPLASITPGTGSGNAGALYSFGAAGDADRALGGLGSNGTYWGSPGTGTVAGWIAVALTNGTSSLIDSVTLAFDGEQWRDGGNTNAQTMVLEYGIGAAFEAVTWTAPGGNFDFVSPIHSATGVALNGNDPANRMAGLGGSLSGLPWGVGETLWVRWIENNDTGNDHGLAVDNFSVTSSVVQPPADDADFNADGKVDGADFLAWQRGFGAGSTLGEGNANGDGVVDAADLEIWKAQYGQSSVTVAVGAVPEPSTCLLGAIGLVVSLGVVRRRS